MRALQKASQTMTYDKELDDILVVIKGNRGYELTMAEIMTISPELRQAKAKLSALLRRVDRDGRVDELQKLWDMGLEHGIDNRLAELKALAIGENNG